MGRPPHLLQQGGDAPWVPPIRGLGFPAPAGGCKISGKAPGRLPESLQTDFGAILALFWEPLSSICSFRKLCFAPKHTIYYTSDTFWHPDTTRKSDFVRPGSQGWSRRFSRTFFKAFGFRIVLILGFHWQAMGTPGLTRLCQNRLIDPLLSEAVL